MRAVAVGDVLRLDSVARHLVVVVVEPVDEPRAKRGPSFDCLVLDDDSTLKGYAFQAGERVAWSGTWLASDTWKRVL